MSEYTSYAAVHVNDLKMVCNELSSNNITSVLLSDFDHPLYDSEYPKEKWNSLSYKNQWLIFMAKKSDCNRFKFLPLSIYLMVDEGQDRWSLGLYKNGEKKEFLFSDTPWGDVCAPNPNDDWRRIENANNISELDLIFMEDLFQIEHTKFADYLKMGSNMVWKFLEVAGLPAMEMLCDWGFHYPEEGKNRCLLWNEYEKITD